MPCRQLRMMLNIHYPVKITNASLYKNTDEKPLSTYILESRWRLFGHILRRHEKIPANKAMEAYYTTSGDKFRGRPVTTLPTILNKDLSRLPTPLKLKTKSDLKHLRFMAQDRKRWQNLTRRIREAAEASSSEH